MPNSIELNFCPKCGGPLTYCMIDGVERKACASRNCTHVFWDNPTPVAAGLVAYQGDFLLARNIQWPLEMYSIITGFVEAGELPEETIVREVGEELGLAVESVQFIGHFSLGSSNQLLIAYLVGATGVISINEEIAEICRLSKNDLVVHDFGPLGLTAEIVARAFQ